MIDIHYHLVMQNRVWKHKTHRMQIPLKLQGLLIKYIFFMEKF